MLPTHQSSDVLDLDDYRTLVALDVPYVPPPPAADVSRAAIVDRVVTALRRERPDLPRDAERLDQRQLLRALLTIRSPHPIPAAVGAELDELLQRETLERHVVEHTSLLSEGGEEHAIRLGERQTLWRGDITRLRIDAIVNAGNDRLLGCFVPFHRCVDNAIHDAAGPRLRLDCAAIMEQQGCDEPPGGAKVTRAYNLPSRYVLHTVGPIVCGNVEPQHSAALASCYDACLVLAQRVGIRSIAFCAISTGLYGFPKAPAAAIASSTVTRWLAAHPNALDHVVFNVFDEDSFNMYLRHAR